MNLVNTKKSADLQLHDLSKVEFETVDKTVKSATFFNNKGDVAFKLGVGRYDSFDVLVPAPLEMVEKYRVSGEVNGIQITALFDQSWEADNKISEFGDTTHNLKVEKVQAPKD